MFNFSIIGVAETFIFLKSLQWLIYKIIKEKRFKETVPFVVNVFQNI